MLSSQSRLFLAGSCLLIASTAVLATEKPAMAASRKVGCEMGAGGLCASGPVGGGEGHEFGSYGGQFYCFPNGCHSNTQAGICNQYHVECDLS